MSRSPSKSPKSPMQPHHAHAESSSSSSTTTSFARSRLRHASSAQSVISRKSFREESTALQRLKDSYDALFHEWSQTNRQQAEEYTRLCSEEASLSNEEKKESERYRFAVIERISQRSWHRPAEDELADRIKTWMSRVDDVDPVVKDKQRRASVPSSSSTSSQQAKPRDAAKKRRYIW